MNRALVVGGAIAAILLVSAAGAYTIVESAWWGAPAKSAMANAPAPARPAPAPAFSAGSPPNISAPATTASITSQNGPGPQANAAPAAFTAPPSTASIGAPAPATAPIAALLPAAAPVKTSCANPNAMGVSRVVEIDTTGGPGFGSQHFNSYDFLRDHEVVLTFDDGPWPGHTQAVLKALADQCLKATFFPIGKHATYHPEILKMVLAAGMTVGSHTWSHADLEAVTKKNGPDAARDEIEKGISAVHMMANAPIAPFFRFPDLRHPPEMVTYLGQRNVAVFSTDVDSWDFKIKKPDELVKSLIAKVQKRGKAIILMHDFQKVTAAALPQILGQLHANGFKVVHMVPRGMLQTLPEYDEAVLKENKLQTVTNRPQDSVVRTISGDP